MPYPHGTLIIAAASARSLAASAANAGYHILCTDFFGDQDLMELLDRCAGTYLGRLNAFTDLSGLLAKVPANIPLLWAGGLENHLELLSQIARTRPLLGLPLDVVAYLRDPAKLSSLLSASGSPHVRFPQSIFAGLPPAGRWLWKPTTASGGLGVQRLTEDSRQRLTAAQLTTPGCFQQELDGLPCSAVVACDGQAAKLVGMSLQFCGWPELQAEEFRFCGNLGPLEIPPRLATALMGALQALLRQCGQPGGILGVDLLLTRDICWLLEINPRIPASHWIYEFPGHWNSVSFNQQPVAAANPLSPPLPMRAQLVVWSRNRFCFPELPAEALQRTETLRIADRPRVGAEIPAGSPVCSLLIEQPPQAGIRQLAAAVKQLPPSLSSAMGIQSTALSAAILSHTLHWQSLAVEWS
jgi:predicted ATP-grasp superfamily ATP-dependent carboligase